ncbi:MAG: 50S ribosomal protein L10 [Caldilineaceae bacterium]|nr:50S ribosomal protein L10 [Caldilineaceae bacterium]
MAITRQKKEELVARYREVLDQSSAVVFTNYKGTSVAQLRSLRGKLKEHNTTCIVVKNSLFKIALGEKGFAQPEELLVGTNAVIFVGEDIGKGVTALKDWIKDAKVLEIRGAVLEKSVLNAEQAEALSDLPTKEQTLAMVLGAINAPASTLVRMINAPGASLARVINAYIEKQQEAGAA